jgi:hypothetical protein
VTIKHRLAKLEKEMAPNQYHAFQYITERQTKQEALEQYCAKKGLDPVKFKNKEYGDYLVIQNDIIAPKKPGDKHHGA